MNTNAEDRDINQKLHEAKCICPSPETLRAFSGDVVNWPRWNVDDCAVHKGDNPDLEEKAFGTALEVK